MEVSLKPDLQKLIIGKQGSIFYFQSHFKLLLQVLSVIHCTNLQMVECIPIPTTGSTSDQSDSLVMMATVSLVTIWECAKLMENGLEQGLPVNVRIIIMPSIQFSTLVWNCEQLCIRWCSSIFIKHSDTMPIHITANKCACVLLPQQ